MANYEKLNEISKFSCYSGNEGREMFSFHIHMERIHMGLRERYTGLCFVGGEAQSWVEIVYILSSFLSPHLLRGYDVYEDNAEVFSLEDGYCSTVYGFQWERVFEENFTGSVGKRRGGNWFSNLATRSRSFPLRSWKVF